MNKQKFEARSKIKYISEKSQRQRLRWPIFIDVRIFFLTITLYVYGFKSCEHKVKELLSQF